MPPQREICVHHETRNMTISEHGERIKAVEVEVGHMKTAHSTFLERFDSVTDDAKSALKELCTELKITNKKLNELANDIKIGEIRRERKETKIGEGDVEERVQEPFSKSLNRAWRHFQNNFAVFCIYAAAAGFVWFILRAFVDNWGSISGTIVKMFTAQP